MGYYVALYRVLELKSYSIPQRETGGRLSLWAYAAHPCGYFSFTRKVSKSVSKGIPLRYPLGQVTVKAGGANQNDAPSP